MQDDRGRVARADLGGQHRQAVEVVVLDVDLARLEPALDEARRRAQSVDVRRVIGDQALGQGAFVHPAQSIGGVCQDFGSGRHGVPPESSASPRSGKSWSAYVQPGSAVAKTAGNCPWRPRTRTRWPRLRQKRAARRSTCSRSPARRQADAVAARHLLARAGVAAGRRDRLARLGRPSRGGRPPPRAPPAASARRARASNPGPSPRRRTRRSRPRSTTQASPIAIAPRRGHRSRSPRRGTRP